MTQRIPQQPTQRHHYIPEFYTKAWATACGKLCEFRRCGDGVVRARPTAPKGTGFKDNLYTLRGYPVKQAQDVEQEFFQVVDDRAAKLRAALTTDARLLSMSAEEKSSWIWFLLSLMFRTPEQVDRLRASYRQAYADPPADLADRYAEIRTPDQPATLPEYLAVTEEWRMERSFFNAFISMMMSQRVGQFMIEMRWSVLNVSDAPFELLTSDRPVVRTNGLDIEGGHLAMPMSPRHVFIAATDAATMRRIDALSSNQIVRAVNTRVVTNAQKYVYARSPTQLRFVSRHFGTANRPDEGGRVYIR